MTTEDILGMQMSIPAIVIMLVLVVAATAFGLNLVIQSDKPARKLPTMVLILAVGWVPALFIAHYENGRVEKAEAAVASAFKEKYGLELDSDDLIYLRGTRVGDRARNLEAADGSLKQVLFHDVDGNVLPHTLDADGSWVPVPTLDEAQ